MVVNWFICGGKKQKKTLFPCFTHIPETGVGLPETGVSFYCRSAEVRNQTFKVELSVQAGM